MQAGPGRPLVRNVLAGLLHDHRRLFRSHLSSRRGASSLAYSVHGSGRHFGSLVVVGLLLETCRARGGLVYRERAAGCPHYHVQLHVLQKYAGEISGEQAQSLSA